MQGHIWIESEGVGKGCTATFTVKLEFCENPNKSPLQIVPLPWAMHVEEDVSNTRGMLSDPRGSVPLKPRF